ncbi:MAG: alpha/beta hydrolase, partial [Chloroflexi bacterium]|nr:alpha/beta hydrolase [Chloroflexota bacterium]
ISGALDAATPPRYAAAALERLPNGHHVVLPVRGHAGGLFDACALEIRDRFLTHPETVPDTACTADPVPFRTDLAVNRGVPALMQDVLRNDPDRSPGPPTAAVLAVCGVVLASGLAVGLYRLVRRRADASWLLALVAAVLFLGFGTGIALIATGWLGGLPEALMFGVPRSVGWLLWLPVLGAMATGALVVAVLIAWVRRVDTATARLHLTGIAVAASLVSWVLLTYGAIG